MSEASETGRLGEREAARLLLEEGYAILRRNYRANGAEIDIIAQRGSLTVFVEVKARTVGEYGEPIDAVDRKKRGRLRAAAEGYVEQHPDAANCRFDVIEVYIGRQTGKLERVRHSEGAFEQEG